MKGTVSPEYGFCYTFFEERLTTEGDKLNATSREEFLEIVDNDLPWDGLHLVLDVHDEEYLPFLVEEGFLLMVHRPIDDADVSKDAILVPTNRATFVAVQKVVAEECFWNSNALSLDSLDSSGFPVRIRTNLI